jgi:DNA replication initiation complex subunit (GINS family)
MITYNDIYEAARKERYSKQLQNLPKKFIHEVAIYIKEKREASFTEEDFFSDSIIKTKKQLENAITLFKELMLRRRKKILGLVLVAAETGISKQDFENMFDFEKQLFDELMKCINYSDKSISQILNGIENKENKNEMIIFLDNITEFLGFEGEKMGPYEKGQIADIPKEIAKILIEDKKAEVIVE